jgi:hypothetical protein
MVLARLSNWNNSRLFWKITQFQARLKYISQDEYISARNVLEENIRNTVAALPFFIFLTMFLISRGDVFELLLNTSMNAAMNPY